MVSCRIKKCRLMPLIPFIVAILVFCACGQPSIGFADELSLSDTNSSSKAQSNSDDAELLEGEWNCAAMMVDGELRTFSDYPQLESLYDQVLFIFPDGTYSILDTPYGERGLWQRLGESSSSDGFARKYSFSKTSTVKYDIKDGVLENSEVEDSGSAIVGLYDGNTDILAWIEKGEGRTDTFVYVRGEGSYSGGYSGDSSSTSPRSSSSSKNSSLNSRSKSDSSNSRTSSKRSAGTVGQQNALDEAKAYLNTMPFSYSSLVEQLEYEGYSTSEAEYGAANCGADWDEQAKKSAMSYLRTSAFSESGLIEQLEYEGFTSSEAEYGVAHCGADWNEQAAKSAASYIELLSMSRSELIDQLEFEGFTHSQAVYGAEKNGL